MSSKLAAGLCSVAAKRTFVLYAILIIAAGAIVLALPMLINGAYPGDDIYEHLTFNRHFSEQFWAGEWYPRWLIGVNHGLGTPSFFVFPPIAAYVYAILDPLSNALHLNTFVAEEFLVLFASSVCAFLWLSTISARWSAVAGALLYMLAPYHLAVDLYKRTALPECWALVWIPLLLYLTNKIVTRKRVAIVSFAVAYALLILSHPVSALIFLYIPVLTALFLPARGQRLRSVRSIVEGMLLGIGLSCFYLIPALCNAGNFPPLRLGSLHNLDLYLISIQNIFITNRHLLVIATSIDAIAVCVLCGAAVIVKGSPDSKKLVSFWLAVSVVPALMMCGLISPVWRGWPALWSAVQYPFRLNVILCIAEVAIVTILLSQAKWTSRFFSRLRLILILLVVIPWLSSYGMVWKYYAIRVNARAVIAGHDETKFYYDGWFESWSAPGLDQETALQASAGPLVRFAAGPGTATVIAWKPRHIEFETNSSTGGEVMVNQFYYPAWQAELAASAERLETSAALPAGLVAIHVPPGQADVRLDIPRETAERVGLWISVLSVLVCVCLALRS